MAASDFENYIQSANPFTYRPTLIGSPSTPVARNYGDLGMAANWANQQRANQNALMSSYSQTPQGGAGGWGTAPLVHLNINGGNPSNQGDPNAPTPFTKNQPLQQSINSVLGNINGLSNDPNQNPYQLRDNVKNQQLQGQITGAQNTYDSRTQQNRQSLEDFTKQYLGANPQAQQIEQRDLGAIQNVYGGANDPNSMAFNLNSIWRQDNQAAQRLANLRLQQAGVASKAGVLAGGTDSSLNAALAGAAANIGVQQANRSSDLARQNYMALMGARLSNVGRSNDVMNNYLTRGLLPVQAQNAQAQAELGQLGSLGQINNANNQYTLDSPDMMLQRKLGLLGQYSGIDTANTAWKLPYQWTIPGAGGRPTYSPAGPSYQPQGPGEDLMSKYSALLGQQTAPNIPPGANPYDHGADLGVHDYSQGINVPNNFNYADPRLRGNSPSLYQQGGLNPQQQQQMRDFYDGNQPDYSALQSYYG